MSVSGSFAVLLLLPFIICVVPSTHADNKNTQSLSNWLRLMRSKRQESYSDSEKKWTLSDALPGIPEQDYPILSEIPNTDFSCLQKTEGYYADIDARCQVFRVCANTADDTSKGFGFLCPNGTLFNQEYFVCDWYMNVDCANSEKFYGLNDQIGKGDALSMNDLMRNAKDMISFPKKMSNLAGGIKNPSNNQGSGPNRNSQSRNDGINTAPGGGNNKAPSRGSANLGQPTNGNYPYSSSSRGGNNNFPQRGANGGTIYVNSLGQLSTDKDSGFDERNSFILRPDKDSSFDQDFRVPSNSFDALKGIGNSYSFGVPGSIPLRGSEDLSEPVDPADYRNDKYLPPYVNNVPKQIYTYPNEHTGQLNTKLAANSPKFQAPQVYGPAISNFQGANNRPAAGNGQQFRPQQQQRPNTAPVKLYQQPGQQSNSAPARPQQQQQQPQVPRSKNFPKQQQQQQQPRQQQNYQQQNYQQPPQQIERRVFVGTIPNNQRQNFLNTFQPQQQQNLNHNGNYNNNQRSNHGGGNSNNNNNNNNNGNQSSNEGFLRNLLRDMTHIHNDKTKLVELIQRLFVPSTSNMKVVSAEVYPSQPRESYVFTYPDDSLGSSSSQHDRNHSHSKSGGNCGGGH